MRAIKAVLLSLLFVGFAVAAQAQTITQQLAWTQPTDTLAVVNTYKYSLVIDATPAIVITPTCVRNGANVDCTSQVLAFPLVNHVFSLTVTAVSGLSNTAVLNYVPGLAPTVIQSFTVITKISVP